MLFVDAAVTVVTDSWAELCDASSKYEVSGEFNELTFGPLIEHPLIKSQTERE